MVEATLFFQDPEHAKCSRFRRQQNCLRAPNNQHHIAVAPSGPSRNPARDKDLARCTLRARLRGAFASTEGKYG